MWMVLNFVKGISLLLWMQTSVIILSLSNNSLTNRLSIMQTLWLEPDILRKEECLVGIWKGNWQAEWLTIWPKQCWEVIVLIWLAVLDFTREKSFRKLCLKYKAKDMLFRWKSLWELINMDSHWKKFPLFL